MPRSALFAIDIVAISIMVFGLYFPRHHRRDLLVAFLAMNIGVLSVADALSSTETGAGLGLGLGLFGVLSIIRLRSSELDQEEVAYFFVALALGLLGGLQVSPQWLAPVLMATLLLTLYLGDHPRLFPGYRTQAMTLDAALTDEPALIAHLEGILDGKIHQVRVRRVDLVNASTTVEVRYRVPVTARRARGEPSAERHRLFR